MAQRLVASVSAPLGKTRTRAAPGGDTAQTRMGLQDPFGSQPPATLKMVQCMTISRYKRPELSSEIVQR